MSAATHSSTRKNSKSSRFYSLSAVLLLSACALSAQTADSSFGPSNPFYQASNLPFHAPPFDKIKDSDYQPAIDAGMAQQIAEIETIANNSAEPTFDNTIVAF